MVATGTAFPREVLTLFSYILEITESDGFSIYFIFKWFVGKILIYIFFKITHGPRNDDHVGPMRAKDPWGIGEALMKRLRVAKTWHVDKVWRHPLMRIAEKEAWEMGAWCDNWVCQNIYFLASLYFLFFVSLMGSLVGFMGSIWLLFSLKEVVSFDSFQLGCPPYEGDW